MIIAEVLTALETATGPVVSIMQKSEHFKVIVLGFKKGMILKEHQTDVPARLVVITGAVTYKEADRTIGISTFDELDIPVNVMHSVEALEDSICFLIRG